MERHSLTFCRLQATAHNVYPTCAKPLPLLVLSPALPVPMREHRGLGPLQHRTSPVVTIIRGFIRNGICLGKAIEIRDFA